MPATGVASPTTNLSTDPWGAAGVFALQLHGLEHYWPDALMAANDPAVRSWLEGEMPAATE